MFSRLRTDHIHGLIISCSEESLDAGPDGGPNFAEILNKALPDSDHSSCDSHSDRSSNSGEVSEKCDECGLNCISRMHKCRGLVLCEVDDLRDKQI